MKNDTWEWWMSLAPGIAFILISLFAGWYLHERGFVALTWDDIEVAPYDEPIGPPEAAPERTVSTLLVIADSDTFEIPFLSDSADSLGIKRLFIIEHGAGRSPRPWSP